MVAVTNLPSTVQTMTSAMASAAELGEDTSLQVRPQAGRRTLHTSSRLGCMEENPGVMKNAMLPLHEDSDHRSLANISHVCCSRAWCNGTLGTLQKLSGI